MNIYRMRIKQPSLSLFKTFFILLMMVFSSFAVHAADLDLEKDLQGKLEQSRKIIETARVKQKAGNATIQEAKRLRVLGEEVAASKILLKERLKVRGQKVKSLNKKAVDRHQAATESYAKALDEYLDLVNTIPANGSIPDKTLNKLETRLDKIVHKKTRPPIGSLPYKNLNFPATEPSTAPTITPAYRGGISPTMPDDLKSTTEAPISAETKSLARSLNWNPVLIYEYVKNSIDTEWYWGCMKGAEDTLHQKSGNDCDQAALLTALLRASGYPTRYVRGTIEFFPDIARAKNLTNIDDPARIAEFFQKAGIPFKTVLDGTTIKNIQIEHIWVETLVPYSNYRGAVTDDQGKIWLGLDTSIKASGYTYNTAPDIASEFTFTGLRDTYLGSIRSETATDYLRGKINEYLVATHPTTTYNDYLATKTLVPEVMQILPSSMQFDQVKVTDEYTEIPGTLKHKVAFTAMDAANNQLFTTTQETLGLSNKSIALTYEPETVEDQEIIDSYGGLDATPAYLVRLRPMLTVDGTMVTAGQDGLAMGSDHTLRIDVYSPSVNGSITSAATFTNAMITGNLSVIGIVSQTATTSPPNTDNDKDAERLLYEAAMNYAGNWNKAENELASLLRLSLARPLPSIVTLGGVIDVTYLLGEPYGFTWKGEYIDADLRTIEIEARSQTTDDRLKLFMQLSGLQGSVLEYKVFEDDLQVMSISTAKVLQLANQGSGLLTVDGANIASVLPTLPFDDSIKDDMQNAANQGYQLQTPNSELVYNDWTGVGYLNEDPASGQSGWMLSGSIAGGMTALSPDKWGSSYAKTVLGNPFHDDTRNIFITSPTNESTVNGPIVLVTGVVLDPEATVTVNGVPADIEGAAFRAAVTLTSGDNTIKAVAVNKAGKPTFDIIAIRYKIPVKIYITYPFDNAELSVSPIYVEGRVSDPACTVYVSGTSATVASDGGFIANNVSLAEGANQIVASAMNSDGDLDSQTITITYHTITPQPQLALTITSPASGGVINKPATTVAGTVTSTASEVWVTVNNMPATVSGNQFVVNNVPLTDGSNLIIVNASDSNGAMTRQEIAVTVDTTVPHVQLNANVTSGIAPVNGYFTVSMSLTNTVISYQLDYEGDGTIDYTGAMFDNITHAYTTEGIYHPKVTVTDSQGNIYNDTITIVVINKTAIEALMKDKWSSMKTALLSGNVEKALQGFAANSQQRYRDVFAQVGNSRLTVMFADIADIKLITQNENIAECEALRQESRGLVAYPVTFVKDAYGVWKMAGF